MKGHERAKRAALIAAAGGHNMLLIGPPGEGKLLVASAISGILARLRDEEKVLLTKIYSACGSLMRNGVAVTRRPVRSVHHSAIPPLSNPSWTEAAAWLARARLRCHISACCF